MFHMKQIVFMLTVICLIYLQYGDEHLLPDFVYHIISPRFEIQNNYND